MRELLPTTLAVQDSAKASSRWLKDSELPDVVDLQDLIRRPDLAAEAIQRRRLEGTEHGRPRTFDYPKPTGAFRHLTVLDNLAQQDYRQRVGGVVQSIERSLSPSVYRVRSHGSGARWQTRPWQESYRDFKSEIELKRQSGEFEIAIEIDVASHYANIRTEHLRRSLATSGAEDCAVDPLIGWIDRLHEIPGLPDGLPVAVEASGPLGSIALIPID